MKWVHHLQSFNLMKTTNLTSVLVLELFKVQLVPVVCVADHGSAIVGFVPRMRKWRLQLMPLHNLDNADSDEEELLNDDHAPTFQVRHFKHHILYSLIIHTGIR